MLYPALFLILPCLTIALEGKLTPRSLSTPLPIPALHCRQGDKPCGSACIPQDYECCPGRDSGGCPQGSHCEKGSNGVYGCCEDGKECFGPGTQITGATQSTTSEYSGAHTTSPLSNPDEQRSTNIPEIRSNPQNPHSSPSAPPAGNIGAGGSTSGSLTATNPGNSDDGTPIGVIVGAVIGAVLGLALMGGVIFLLCLRRKRRRQDPVYNKEAAQHPKRPSARAAGFKALISGRWEQPTSSSSGETFSGTNPAGYQAASPSVNTAMVTSPYPMEPWSSTTEAPTPQSAFPTELSGERRLGELQGNDHRYTTELHGNDARFHTAEAPTRRVASGRRKG